MTLDRALDDFADTLLDARDLLHAFADRIRERHRPAVQAVILIPARITLGETQLLRKIADYAELHDQQIRDKAAQLMLHARGLIWRNEEFNGLTEQGMLTAAMVHDAASGEIH